MNKNFTFPEMGRNCILYRMIFPVLFLLLFFVSGHAETIVTGNPSGHWTQAGSPYVIQGSVTIIRKNDLTIDPGVEVRFNTPDDRLYVYGRLIASGTISDSIRFRGVPDPGNDHVGGIFFAGNSINSVLDYVVVDNLSDSAIIIITSSITISHSHIRNSLATGIDISAPATPTISDNIFTLQPVSINASPASMMNLQNCYNAIIKIKNKPPFRSGIFPKQPAGSYYLLAAGGLYISPGCTLELKPGVEIHCTSYNDLLRAGGTLIARGTPTDSIRFIGYPNPLYVGSSHGASIIFKSTSLNSVLEYVAMDRWGDSSHYKGAITIYDSTLTISHCNIRNSESSGIFLEDTCKPTISNNDLAGNEVAMSASGNNLNYVTGNNGAIMIRKNAVTTNGVIPFQSEGAYYYLAGEGMRITQKGSLEILPKVEIRSYHRSDSIVVYGRLVAKGTPTDSIRFRCIPRNDNSLYKGGANLVIKSSAGKSELAYVSIDGYGDSSKNLLSVAVFAEKCKINHCSILNSEAGGIYLQDTIKPVISDNNFTKNVPAFSGNGMNFTNITNNTNAEISIRYEPFEPVIVNSIFPMPGPGSYYSLVYFMRVDARLEIMPGVEIQSKTGSYFGVSGTLIAKGTAANPIHFTRNAEAYATGRGRGGTLDMSGHGSILQYVIMDGWGDSISRTAALRIDAPNLIVDHCSISNCGYIAIINSLWGGSTRITSTDLFNNQIGVFNIFGSIILTDCNIYNNKEYGVRNEGQLRDSIDARNNYWGANEGPYHPVLNINGKGNQVGDRVKFIPWIKHEGNQEQSIDLPVIPGQYVYDSLKLTATASSGLPVVYTITTTPDTGVARLSHDVLYFSHGVGTVSLFAKQFGDSLFKPDSITRIITVTKRGQHIVFDTIATKSIGQRSFQLTATATSGLPVVYHIVSGPATVEGNKIFLISAGEVTVVATQPGNSRYDSAISVQQRFMVRPYLPDFSVGAVIADKSLIGIGDTVTVSWRVTNIGQGATLVNWKELIYVQGVDSSNQTYLKQSVFSRTDSLKVEDTVWRSEKVVIPNTLYVGDKGVFVIRLLPNVPEKPGTDLNNTGIQHTAFVVRKPVSLALSGHQIREGTPGSIIGTVSRAGSLKGALSLNIHAAGHRLSFPDTVTIPVGKTAVSFNIQALNDNIVQGTTQDSIQLTGVGIIKVKAGITIYDNDTASLAITNLAATVKEGNNVTFTISTDLPHTTPLEVFLASSSPTRVPLPASVMIPANRTYVTVGVPLKQDSIPEIEVSVRITANAKTHYSATGVILLKDDDVVKMTIPSGYCINGAADILTGLPSGGTFSGDGIGGQRFYPAKAGIGSHLITYTYNGLSASQEVMVYPVPAPVIKPGGSTTFLKGDSVLLTANSGDGNTYQWLRDGTAIKGATEVSYKAATGGSYRVSISANGCTGVSASLTLEQVNTLSAENFAIATTGESCRTAGNGSVTINAAMSLNYSVSVKGGHVDTSYKFTKREMISSLAAGNYTLCITVDGQPDYRQCLDVVISKPADLGAYLIVNNTLRQATLTLSGSETYAITLNGRIFTTSERTVTLPLTDDVNTLQVSTDKACQGTFKKTIMLSKELIYPNPFSDKVSIQLKENAGELVYVEVRDMKGLVLFNYQYKNENGTISVSLPGLAAATYLLKVRTGISESVYKIIKQ